MLKFQFVIFDRSDDAYSTGRILGQIGDKHFLVQFDNMHDSNSVLPAELFHINEMTYTVPDDGLKRWRFFETEIDRQKWIDWLNSPSPPKIVSLVKK